MVGHLESVLNFERVLGNVIENGEKIMIHKGKNIYLLRKSILSY